MLLTSLTSSAFDEFTSMPAHFREYDERLPEPTLGRMLNELDQRMMPFQSRAATRAEFKNLMQCVKEGLREFSMQVRPLDDVANKKWCASER